MGSAGARTTADAVNGLFNGAEQSWRSPHGRKQRLAGKMRAEIVDHELPDRGTRLDRGAAMVRLHDDAGKLQQIGRRIGLILEHVEGGMAETTFGERRDERGLVDDAAARDIDESAVRPQ